MAAFEPIGPFEIPEHIEKIEQEVIKASDQIARDIALKILSLKELDVEGIMEIKNKCYNPMIDKEISKLHPLVESVYHKLLVKANEAIEKIPLPEELKECCDVLFHFPLINSMVEFYAIDSSKKIVTGQRLSV